MLSSISSPSKSVSVPSKSCLHPFQSIHRGSIANLDEWLQHLPPPFCEEPEEDELQEAPQHPEEEEIREVSPRPKVLEILEDVEESDLSVRSMESVQPQPIQVPPDIADFEYCTATPPQEPELHQELLSVNLTPSEIVPPTPTPEEEEPRSPSPVFDSQPFPSISFNVSSVPTTPKSEEEQVTNVDIIYISDDDEIQSPDLHIDSSPHTPSPTIPIAIDTTLLYRGPDPPMIVAPPSPVHDPQYNFDAEFSFDPVDPHVKDELSYHLPLLNSLPPEFRKKTTRTQRKREKERERTEVRKEREEWTPMGMARWRALLRANPTWQHLAKSTKSLTTKDWNVKLRHILDSRIC